jgi:YmdB-like protein
VLGRVFVDRTSVSPFEAADRAVADLVDLGANLVLVDVHAEATSEKRALGYHLAGRAQAVLGTHTHVPTADATVLPGGTAYATDVGMTGCEESIIGFDGTVSSLDSSESGGGSRRRREDRCCSTRCSSTSKWRAAGPWGSSPCEGGGGCSGVFRAV